MDRILRMVMNRVIGQLVRRGVDAGIDRAARGSSNAREASPDQEARVRQTSQRGRQAMRVARRFMRF